MRMGQPADESEKTASTTGKVCVTSSLWRKVQSALHGNMQINIKGQQPR